MKKMPIILSKKYRDMLVNCRLSILDAEFSMRTRRALETVNIKTISQLAKLKQKDYLKIRNCGPKMLKEIKENLTELVKGSLNLDICNLNEQIRVLERHVDDLRHEIEVAKREWAFYMQPFKDFFKTITDYQWRQ